MHHHHLSYPKNKIRNMSSLLVGLLWFSSSALLSTWANTTFLRTFADPLLHTLIRFAGSAILGTVAFLSGKKQLGQTIYNTSCDVIVPALLLWIANFFNSYSLQIAGITLTYVVKACIPVFTVIICTIQGQKFSLLVYVSLIPICCGVAMASGSDLDFSVLGLSAALISAIAQTFMNISIKSVRSRTSYTGIQAFTGMTIVCTLVTIPVVILATFHDGKTINKILDVHSSLQQGDIWPTALIVISSFAYYVEYVLNFIFVGYVNPVTFSVSDIARRVAIISTGAVVFHKPLTAMNWIGISVALFGVLSYSYIEAQSSQVVVNSVPTQSTTPTTKAKKSKSKKKNE